MQDWNTIVLSPCQSCCTKALTYIRTNICLKNSVRKKCVYGKRDKEWGAKHNKYLKLGNLLSKLVMYRKKKHRIFMPFLGIFLCRLSFIKGCLVPGKTY